MEEKWKKFISCIESGKTKAEAIELSGVSYREYSKLIKNHPKVQFIIHERWKKSRRKRMQNMSPKPGKTNGRFVEVIPEVAENIFEMANKVLIGKLKISRKELYSMFPPLQDQKVRNFLRENGFDIHKLPHRGRELYGARNFWFGKEPPKGSGRGISGWVL